MDHESQVNERRASYDLPHLTVLHEAHIKVSPKPEDNLLIGLEQLCLHEGAQLSTHVGGADLLGDATLTRHLQRHIYASLNEQKQFKGKITDKQKQVKVKVTDKQKQLNSKTTDNRNDDTVIIL